MTRVCNTKGFVTAGGAVPFSTQNEKDGWTFVRVAWDPNVSLCCEHFTTKGYGREGC